jgi:hypothetical protein
MFAMFRRIRVFELARNRVRRRRVETWRFWFGLVVTATELTLIFTLSGYLDFFLFFYNFNLTRIL